MDTRRVLLAIVLSLAVVIVYNEFIVKPRQPMPRPPQTTAGDALPPTASTIPAQPAQPSSPTAGDGGYLSFVVGEQPPIIVETDVFRAMLTPQGGRLTSLQLKAFRKTVEPDSPLLELVAPGPLLPLTLVLGASASDAGVLYTADRQALTLSGASAGDIVLTGRTAAGQDVEKRLRFTGNAYVFEVAAAVRGGESPQSIGLVMPHLEHQGLDGSGRATDAAVILSNGKISETALTADAKDLKPHQVPDASWVAFSVPFFAGAVVATSPAGDAASVEPIGSKTIIRLDEPVANGRAAFKIFMGPKAKEVLEEAGLDLSRLVDFGWFWFIAIPMLNALRWLHRLTGNWGVDIILLTILVRAATMPLTQKSFRSMKDMQRIQPQLKRLQEQYKDDQAKLQKEMMELYKRNNVNPFAGCLPMVLQIPIFVGLYNALSHAIELRHAPFALWITDLSAPERMPLLGWHIPVMTILMGASMLVQQWLTPQQTADPAQRQVMMIMPIAFTFMFYNFPSGLVLYWLVSNLLGIAQQYVMLRAPARSD
jgi:YidC/Oxa1 family membrane protein insertase